MEDLEENQTKKRRLAEGLFKATHYRSYHSYRRSLKVGKSFLVIGIIFALTSLIPILLLQTLALNIAVICLTVYLLTDYWVASKSQMMKKESEQVITSIFEYANLNEKINGWNLFTGIYGSDSLELTFTNEKSFLGDALRLIRGEESTLPLNENNIEAIKYFLERQNEQQGFIVYATMTEMMAENFTRRGIVVKQIENKYRSLPSRWDYAVATGRLANALWGYPRDFGAYILRYSKEKGNFEK